MTKQVPIRLFQLSAAVFVVSVASSAAAQGGGVSVEVNIGGTSALDQHVQALSSPDPAARLDAARALGDLGDPAAVEPLSRVARTDPRPEVRGWALRSLHQIGTPVALATIQEVAQGDTDERVRALGSQLVGSSSPAPSPAPAPVPAPAEQQPSPSATATVVVQQQTGVAQGQGGGVVVPQEVGGQPDIYTLQLQRRAGRGLRIAGWITFGVTYGLCFFTGIGLTVDDAEDGWPLFIPAIGPFITAARLFGRDSCSGEYDYLCIDDPGDDIGGAFSIIAGLMQISGIAMLAAGYARRARVMRQGVASDREGRGRSVALLPAGPGDGPGLSLAAVF